MPHRRWWPGRANNPNAVFEVMDGRDIDRLDRRFDAVLCGFCLPYLSTDDCSKLLRDCYRLLHPGGALYISFVHGTASESGYKVSSDGEHKVYFHYHERAAIMEMLLKDEFDVRAMLEIPYTETAIGVETHTVMIAVKR